MTKSQLIEKLNGDLANEYAHMHFYLHSAALVCGLHRAELREFLMEAAASEMKHVQEFADLIVGLGGHPTHLPAAIPDRYADPADILTQALRMEDEVVANYVGRIADAASCEDPVVAKWVELFLEDQVTHSRADADNLRRMLTRAA